MLLRNIVKRGLSEAGRRLSSNQPLEDGLGRQHTYLRISLTERCNLRCQYCMPAGGVKLSRSEELLSPREMLRLVRALAPLGVNKLRLTGGEPTLRRDLPELIATLKGVAGIRTLAMTSNGVALVRRLPALVSAGLDGLNLSLDSLRAERYERLARRPGLAHALATAHLALQLELPLKINVVLMRGINDDELCDFVEFTRDKNLEVHRVHAVRRERVELRPTSTGESGVASAGRAVRVGATDDGVRRDGARVACPRTPGAGGLHLVHDEALLCGLQPAAAHGRRQPQGVPVRGQRSVAARRDPRRRRRPRVAAAGAGCAHAQEASTRWYGAVGTHGEPAYDPHRRIGVRSYSTLSHVGGDGRARMVDVGDKPVTRREAEAGCRVRVSGELLRLLRENALKKGDALTVAQVAGVAAAKRTADLLPLCHGLALDCVNVRLTLPDETEENPIDGGEVQVHCSVCTTAKTGAEMEALVGAAMAALALYDMGKSADRSIRVDGLRLLRKSGGRSDYREGEEKQQKDKS